MTIARFVVKSEKVLGDYRCLHWLVPKNEMPKRLRGKIPRGQIWVRKDVWNSTRRHALIRHESYELMYMTKYGFTYKKAHKIAEIQDGAW